MPVRTYPAISVTQMQEVDRLMVEEFGIVLLQMMENAGRALATLARHRLATRVAGATVIVLVGKGNNGGGGLVAARHLTNAGARVRVALAQPAGDLGDVPEHQRRILARMGVSGSEAPTPPEQLPALLGAADLVIDALIGYRLRGAPREPIASFVRAANRAAAPRLALDIPSGLDGDRGFPLEPTVRADATLTLAWPKAGLLTAAAQPVVGALYLADISVPAAVYRAVGVDPGDLFGRGPLVGLTAGEGTWASTVPALPVAPVDVQG